MAFEGIDYQATVGDYGKTIAGVCADAHGPVDLTDATSVTMRLGREGQTPIATGLADVDPDQATNKGRVTYTFVAGDLDTAGEFELTFVALFPDARLTFPTQPKIVKIKRELAAMS